jgi:hypothetical protein
MLLMLLVTLAVVSWNRRLAAPDRQCAIRVTRRIVPREPRSPSLSVCWKVTRTDSSTVASGGDAVQVTDNAEYTSFEFGASTCCVRTMLTPARCGACRLRRRSRQGAGGNCSRQLRDRGRHYPYLTGPRATRLQCFDSRTAGPRPWDVTSASWTPTHGLSGRPQTLYPPVHFSVEFLMLVENSR